MKEAVPTGGYTLPLVHEQWRLTRDTLQPTGARGALRLAGWLQTRLKKEKENDWLDQRHHPSANSYSPILRLWGPRG